MDLPLYYIPGVFSRTDIWWFKCQVEQLESPACYKPQTTVKQYRLYGKEYCQLKDSIYDDETVVVKGYTIHIYIYLVSNDIQIICIFHDIFYNKHRPPKLPHEWFSKHNTPLLNCIWATVDNWNKCLPRRWRVLK